MKPLGLDMLEYVMSAFQTSCLLSLTGTWNKAMISNMCAVRAEESLNVFVQKRRGSMYLEEETSKRSEVISCIFSLKEEVGALAKALRLFEVNWCTNS